MVKDKTGGRWLLVIIWVMIGVLIRMGAGLPLPQEQANPRRERYAGWSNICRF
jgi:hypothetical protein